MNTIEKTDVKKQPAITKNKEAGTPNRLQQGNLVRKKIEKFVEEDFEILIDEIEELDLKERIKIKLELIKLVVPRPRDPEENEGAKTFRHAFYERFFEKTTPPTP